MLPGVIWDQFHDKPSYVILLFSRLPRITMEGHMPVLFVGHGSPMNAIEENPFVQNWRDLTTHIPQPEAILCISAHWESNGTRVTAMDHPRTIHDFWGFPDALYQMEYPAPGSKTLAETVQSTVQDVSITMDEQWGLDHGTWVVLCQMYPEADIPVCQLSLDYAAPPGAHFALAQQLRPLRAQGVLVIGSGNITHNLFMMAFNQHAFEWAIEYDASVMDYIIQGNYQALVNYPGLPHASLAIPTNEHYLPLLYVLGLQEDGDQLSFSAEDFVLGSVGMRCVLFN